MEKINKFEMIYDSDNDSDQNQVLLPISKFSPPNQIISKCYAPDVKPNFRLMQPQKRQKKKVGISTENKLDSYIDKFDEIDTLGYQYSRKLKNNLAYLKFNNSAYMKYNINGVNYRFLAGMFIPLQKLLGQPLKKAKNIYKVLNNFEYTENKHPITASFGSNCYIDAPHLRFSSNYQSSNLFAAFQVSDVQYDLVLQNDINSKGNTQWFNFTVQINTQNTYKFNIVNLTKSSSLYEKGMNVVYYSQSNRLYNKQGWTRGCHNITYEKSDVNRQDNSNLYYYKLHFQFKSYYKNDVVTFSYSYPYTTLNLQKFFNKVMNRKITNSLKIDKIKISQTLTGIPICVYTICHRKHGSQKTSILNTQNNLLNTLDTSTTPSNTSSVVFMARQHPGESQGSFITEGIVQWLLQNDYDLWKRNFNYYIVPMINADGVFYGNYRTNLSGNDLNRVWKHPRKDYHNQVYCLKKFLFSLNKTSPISLIIDIHGHSNAINSFFYGNPPKKDTQNPKLFPYFCSKKIRQISFSQSTFSITEDKKCCARVVLAEMFPKALVYTFETSFYGWKRGKTIVQFTIQSYKKLGKQLAQSFIEYTRLIEKNSSIKQKWTKEIQEQSKQQRSQEQIVSDSDEQIQNQLIDFRQIFEEEQDNSLIEQMSPKHTSKKKFTVSLGKNRMVRKIRRHPSVSKPKTLTAVSTDNYVTDKQVQVMSQSIGFLSIVKINTNNASTGTCEPAYINTAKSLDKRSHKLLRLKKQLTSDIFATLNSECKQNLSQKYIKVGKLITQKDIVLSKIKQKRMKIQEQVSNNKTNGFFKNVVISNVNKKQN